MRRLPPLVVTLVLVVAACNGAGVAAPAATSPTDLDAYLGLGTWVDVYDYVPEFQKAGEVPAVTASTVDDMKRLGVKTLYLQAAQEDDRSPGPTITPKLLGQFLQRAHKAGVRVVAWYLPHFADLAADLRHVRGLLDFRSRGERFDGLALDIEFRGDVPDPDERSAALVDLSKRVRDLAPDRAIGAIVLEPVLLEVVNADFWPDFPWRKIANLYDVWLPMAYWTNRNTDSGYKDGFRYTDENMRRVRANLGQRDAAVHVIGGIGDKARAQDYEGFVRAAHEQRAIGWSVYSYSVTSSSAWPRLRKS